MRKQELINILIQLFEDHPHLPDPSDVTVVLGDYENRMPLSDVVSAFPYMNLTKHGVFESQGYALMSGTLTEDSPVRFSFRVKLSELGQRESVSKEYCIPTNSTEGVEG